MLVKKVVSVILHRYFTEVKLNLGNIPALGSGWSVDCNEVEGSLGQKTIKPIQLLHKLDLRQTGMREKAELAQFEGE